MGESGEAVTVPAFPVRPGLLGFVIPARCTIPVVLLYLEDHPDR